MSLIAVERRLCSACAQRLCRPVASSAQACRRDYSYSSRGRYRRGTHDVDDIYNDLIAQKRPAPQTRTAPAPPPKETLPKTDREEHFEKARVIFGSRLAGPIDRANEVKAASTSIAGVMVPPRPDEPDNCCMGGCVNCVWDVYRDELEEWAEKRAEADRRLAARGQLDARKSEGQSAQATRGPQLPAHVLHSMDDDGGGSNTNWDLGPPPSATPAGESDLFANIPVGIREFMRTEKRLKLSRQGKQAKRAAATL